MAPRCAGKTSTTSAPTTNWKLSARYDITDNFGLRATVSTGFRAPTPGQSNTVKTTTSIVAGQLQEVGTLPPHQPHHGGTGRRADGWCHHGDAAEARGIHQLDGGCHRQQRTCELHAGLLHIKLKDRIALSSNLTVDRSNPEVQAILDDLADQGVPGVTQLAQFNFFTNDFATTTQGVGPSWPRCRSPWVPGIPRWRWPSTTPTPS